MKVKKVSLAVVIPAIALLACVGVYFGVRAYSGGAPKYVAENGDINVTEAAPPAEPIVGAFPGTETFVPIRFGAGTRMETLTTSSIQTGSTLLESDLDYYDVIDFTSLMSNFTFTFPATSTLSSILRDVGDSRRWIFRNHNTSTSATTLTFTAGAGWDFMGVDTNVDTIDANEVLYMDCFRESASSTFAGMGPVTDPRDIMCLLVEAGATD